MSRNWFVAAGLESCVIIDTFQNFIFLACTSIGCRIGVVNMRIVDWTAAKSPLAPSLAYTWMGVIIFSIRTEREPHRAIHWPNVGQFLIPVIFLRAHYTLEEFSCNTVKFTWHYSRRDTRHFQKEKGKKSLTSDLPKTYSNYGNISINTMIPWNCWERMDRPWMNLER